MLHGSFQIEYSHMTFRKKTVKSEIRDYCVNYNKRLENHSNALANHLLTKTNTQRRLKRYTTYDLATRFN
jgi:hypothetical protein